MANRIIRDWTTSENVDKLSVGAEVFFTRLIMKADDYGSFHGNPKLLRAALFPLKEYADKDVKDWLDQCVKAGLVVSYQADGRDYIRIQNFGQRLRQMKNTFPPPPADNSLTSGGQVADNSPPETKRNETETESETESEGERAGDPVVMVWPTFDDWWATYDKKQERPKCEKKWKKLQQEVREKIMIHTDEYVKATPDKQYRKNPATYLNNECWNDEIILKTNGKQPDSLAAQIRSIDDIVASRDYSRAGQKQRG